VVAGGELTQALASNVTPFQRAGWTCLEPGWGILLRLPGRIPCALGRLYIGLELIGDIGAMGPLTLADL
jgi:hypothetical protein